MEQYLVPGIVAVIVIGVYLIGHLHGKSSAPVAAPVAHLPPAIALPPVPVTGEHLAIVHNAVKACTDEIKRVGGRVEALHDRNRVKDEAQKANKPEVKPA